MQQTKELINAIKNTAHKYNIEPLILYSICATESSFRWWLTHTKIHVKDWKGNFVDTHAIGLGGIVYEIWNKDDGKVYWVADGYPHLCDVQEDPLKLENFFPTPRPLYANATNDTLIPVPDYYQYQDQAAQIDELTQRIALLTH